MVAKLKLPAYTEAEFTRQVLDLAKLMGWRSAHFRPARTSKGWRTAVSGDGSGFPDLVLVRPPRVIFAELKTDKGHIQEAQKFWRSDLCCCRGIEVYLWRPLHWSAIERTLAK